jgi:hypothetical protein
MTTNAQELIPRRRMIRGFATFLVLTAAGLAALYHFTAEGDGGQVLASLSAGFVALAVLSAVADLLIGAVRYQIFLRRTRPGTSLWLPIRADLANRFLGAVTPSQTGGGLAQVFILWRGGIPVPDALSFLLINFLSTLVFFLAAGGVTAWIFRERFPEGGIHLLVRYGFVAFAVCLVAMLVGLFRPDWLARPMAWSARRLEGREGLASRLAHRCSQALAESLDSYRAACTRFIHDNPILPVLSFALTVVLYLNKFTLAWLIMRGLGVHGDYVTTLAVQALLHFVLFVAPSPGGSGIAEIGTGALMALLMPSHLLAPFTLAYRFFLLYLPAAAGGLVLLKALGPDKALAPAPAASRGGSREARRAAAATLAGILLCASAVAAQPAQEPGRAGLDEAESGPGCPQIEQLVIQGLLAADEDSAKAIFRESVGCARELVATSPEEAQAHYLLSVALGYHLEHQGLRKKLAIAAEVRAEAERALELDPDHAGAHHVLGRLHAGTMRLSGFARLVARKILGASVLEGASWSCAEFHFEQAMRSEPESPRHAMELGALYIDTDRPEMARVVLSEAVRLAPREPSDSMAAARAQALLEQLPIT